MRVKVEVNSTDVNCGLKRVCNACPIARAIKRLIRSSFEVMVAGNHIDEVFFYKKKGFVDIAKRKLPKKAAKFVHDFDHFLEPGPFSFAMDIPKEILRSTK